MSEYRNGSDETNQFVEERLNDIKDKAVQKGSKKLSKSLRNGVGKAVKKGAKAGAKAVAFVVKSLLASLGPVVLGFIALIIVVYIIFDYTYESRGKEQAYNSVTAEEDNELELDENGDMVAKELSDGNKMIKAFYTVMADKSYYKLVGDDKVAYRSDAKKTNDGTDLTKVVDKYEREKMFYLNPNTLWTLDEFLNDNEFRYPEQFLKSVPYDADTLELKPITDEEGNLTITSTEYDSNTKLATDKKVPGVWDYGFAPVLHYEKLTEQKEIRGQFNREEYWDADSQTIKTREMSQKIDKTYPVEGFPRSIYMIDKVVTSAGTIANKIVNEEEKGSSVNKEEVYETKVVPIYGWVKTPVEKERTVTKSRIIRKTRQTKEWTTCSLTLDSGYELLYPCYKVEVYYETEYYQVVEKYTEYKDEYKQVEEREIQLRRFFEGNYYETIPKYEGNPDTSMITGNKYFIDYFTNYKTYVPENVMGEFDFSNRTGKDKEEIDKILEDSEGISEATPGGTVVDMGAFQLGSGSASQTYKNALQYLPYFQKWGSVYGVDPYLLVAKASQESGGNHERYITPERCNVAGCGLMQVEKPGIVIKGVSAYNFETKSNDTVSVTGIDSVRTISDNVRVGTMEFASRLTSNNYNVLLSIQAYNYGPGGINAVLKLYSNASGKTVDAIKQDPGDTGWLAYRSEVHNNPSKYFQWSEGTYGDDQYVEHVLRYYSSLDGTTAPYVIKPDGTKVEASGNITTGFISGTSIGGNSWFDKFSAWIRTKFDDIKENWEKLFPNKPVTYSDKHMEFKHYVHENEVQDIVNMMFVMEEKKYLSEYDSMTDEQWKKLYSQLFTNPMGAYWESTFSINPLEYFPKGYESPLKIADAQISKGFGHTAGGGSSEFHKGIDVVAPLGTPVYAIADGTVKVVENSNNSTIGKNIEISHNSSVSTVYGNLNEIKVKKGDTVTKGQLIGTVGNSGGEGGYLLHLELIKDGTEVDGSWIVTGNGVNAVVSGPMSIEGSEKAKQVYSIASQYLGSWYAWGGSKPPTKDSNGNWERPVGTGNYVEGREVTSPGFDCSGLVYYVYRQVGISKIPRVAGAQQSYSKLVNIADAQPGDLVFFGKPAHHVGIYIGNNQYLHAPATNKPVQISNINWSRVTTVGRVLE